MNKSTKRLAAVAVLAVTTVALTGCPRTQNRQPPAQDPEFTRFVVQPSILCLNTPGLLTFRIGYTVALNDWSNPNTLCVDLSANEEKLHPTLHHQCMDDGTEGSYTVSVTDVFGTNVPSSITFKGELVPSVAGETKDTETVTVTTDNSCPPPGVTPQG